MQVRCNIYGLTNASTGVECLIEQELLEVGEYFHYRDQDYIIASVVESQGRWFANVVPKNQLPFARRRSLAKGFKAETTGLLTLQEWRERVDRVEHQLQIYREERVRIGERLDHLMELLELLMKDPNALQPTSMQESRGGKYVR